MPGRRYGKVCRGWIRLGGLRSVLRRLLVLFRVLLFRLLLFRLRSVRDFLRAHQLRVLFCLFIFCRCCQFRFMHWGLGIYRFSRSCVFVFSYV